MDDASQAQIRAADPMRSTWVSANAGSGKTRVLTDRVARLLLRGTPPEAILCLTYTKAAAAEMQTRLFKRLGGWAMLEDDALREELSTLGEEGDFSTERLNSARRLFAKALETPGGLKIQTIHAFCASLLRRFPLEAGIGPGFSELDDRTSALMLQEALEQAALSTPEAVRPLFEATAGAEPESLIEALKSNRAAFEPETFDEAALRRRFGLSAEATMDGLVAETLSQDDLDRLTLLLDTLDGGTSTDAAQARRIRAAHAAGPSPVALAQLEGVFLSGINSKEPFTRKRFPKGEFAKTLSPDTQDWLNALGARIEAQRPARLGLQTLHQTRLLYQFARAVLSALDKAKSAVGALDFDDLILRTRHLLTSADQAAWVLYKLDGGIAHILVDEAQDTSPPQWDVIRALMEEALSGADADASQRTIFAVGDPKQSIYSFQGAAPRAFGAMRQEFRGRLETLPNTRLHEQPLAYSFRSAAPILRVVDTVMQVEGRAGLEAEDRSAHLPFHPNLPGRVELHPWVEKPDAAEESPWFAPVDAPPPDAPDLIIARQVAETIRDLLSHGATPQGDGWRAVEPKDIMVLVRRRAVLFNALIAEMKRLGLPVAGADRITLTDNLAVKDLLAVLRVAVQPKDDLSIAAVLRSPLFDVSEARLYALAANRPKRKPLISVLREDRDSADFIDQHEYIRGKADLERPYELLTHILVARGGRAKLVGRLGAAAEDAIDALLAQALAYEATEAPTLTGFLHWVEQGETVLKREPDPEAREVRVMSVHGAKGLEAPIVILPETAPYKNDQTDSRTVVMLNDIPVWKRGKATEQPEALRVESDAQKERVMQESERLLYVALTRAETRLIVFGGGKPDDKGVSWYEKIKAGMGLAGASVAEDGCLVLENTPWPANATRGVEAEAAEITLPAWAKADVLRPTSQPQPTTPTKLAEGQPHALGGEGLDRDVAMKRGTALHRLLEEPSADVAALWPEGTEQDRAALTAEASAARAHFPALFTPQTLHEVPFATQLQGQPLRGQIDLVQVEPGLVRAIDFKSNTVVPEEIGQIPAGLITQLAAYRFALAQIFPSHQLKLGFLWTRTPGLMWVPDEMLRSHPLARTAS